MGSSGLIFGGFLFAFFFLEDFEGGALFTLTFCCLLVVELEGILLDIMVFVLCLYCSKLEAKCEDVTTQDNVL